MVSLVRVRQSWGLLQVENKLYLTTVSHHEEYYNMLDKLTDVQCKGSSDVRTPFSDVKSRTVCVPGDRVWLAICK